MWSRVIATMAMAGCMNMTALALSLWAIMLPNTIHAQMSWMEAEKGTLIAPMVVVPVAGTSKGAVISTTAANTGTATYTFTAAAGRYVIWGRALFDSTGGKDSFFVKMDAGAEALWAVQSGQNTFGWDRVSNQGTAPVGSPPQFDPVYYDLAAGQHTLTVRGREAGAQLDLILITSDLAYVPSGINYQQLKWYWRETPRIAWDPVTRFTNGEPLPVTDHVRYHTFWRGGDSDAPKQLAEVSTTEVTCTGLPTRRMIHLGVRSVRYRGTAEYPPDDQTKSRSTISWSTDPVATNNNTFGVATWSAGPGPKRVHVSTQ